MSLWRPDGWHPLGVVNDTLRDVKRMSRFDLEKVAGYLVEAGADAMVRGVREWGNEPCPHRAHNAKYFRPRRACTECWQFLEEGSDETLGSKE